MIESKTCCYCGTKVKKINETSDMYYCSFCDMNLNVRSLCAEGKRKSFKIEEVYLDINYSKTTPELMTLSTFELLQLLQHARKIRSDSWDDCDFSKKLVRTMKKEKPDDKESINQAIELAKANFELYTNATKKMYVFENLICERLGYIPKRVTRKYLEKYSELMEERKDTPMKIGIFKV